MSEKQNQQQQFQTMPGSLGAAGCPSVQIAGPQISGEWLPSADLYDDGYRPLAMMPIYICPLTGFIYWGF